ncbi:MAG: L-threonylcarbamoyladenylate synthase [Candidatus Levybacteria bacterium]|nr:L-threonylcarbamoyladenylate synthase [Candidatus Levybacteria bacterium]
MPNITEDINEVAQNLRNGKVGIFPTDTAFGIGCRMDDVGAVKRVYDIRNRPEEKALLVLVNSIEMAREYVEIDDEALELINKYWPGGLTIILKCRKDKVPSIVRAGGDTLAVRLPDHSQLLEIIGNVGVPLVAPSANRSKEPTPFTFEKLDRQLQEEVDFVLTGVCTIKGVSTIIDVPVKPFMVVRQVVVELNT